jgi:metal-responsive CopG/Arc/MetJ family transcriptional regulator
MCSNIPAAMPSKAMSLRLPENMAAELAAVARADDVPVSEAIREAIENHIAARRNDKTFQQRLKKRLEEDRLVLERLAD